MFASKTMQSKMSVSKTVGVKGSDVFDGTGSPLLDLSVRLVRGASAEDLAARIKAVATDYSAGGQNVADAFVMAFHARNIRGGKGERDIFRTLYRALNEVEPYLARNLLDLVPHYGSWRDVFSLTPLETSSAYVEELHNGIYRLAASQLRVDEATEAGKSISLCAKWAPRESSADSVRAQWLAAQLFPGVKPFSAQMKMYRKLVAGLNRRLDTVETHMCSGSWADIKPQSVPGRAGKLYGRAFLNLSSTYKDGHHVTLRGFEAQQIRLPGDMDRMECRKHFEEHFAAAAAGVKGAKVHGADTLQPHELVKKALSLLHSESDAEKDQIRAIWRSLVEKVKGQGGLGRSIMMSDFSGSMQSAGYAGDTPYWVSMALGLLGAECCTGDFKDRFMTFDSTPTWHQLPATKADGAPSDLFDRLASIRGGIGQGLSTDFQKAMDLVLATLKEKRVRPGEEPENLIVLTDMNWDAACGSSEASYYTGNRYRHHVKHAPWETHVEMIRESFKRAGEDIHGEGNGWAMPRIVIWNLAASPSDFHATCDTVGVAMLSGWSATQFKVLCDVGPRQLTALEILRVELDDPQYDRVRERVRAIFEKEKRGTAALKKAWEKVQANWDRGIISTGEGCRATAGSSIEGWGGEEPYISHANGFGAEEGECSSERGWQ